MKQNRLLQIARLKANLHWRRDRVTWRIRSALRDFEMPGMTRRSDEIFVCKRDTSVARGNAKHCSAEVRD